MPFSPLGVFEWGGGGGALCMEFREGIGVEEIIQNHCRELKHPWLKIPFNYFVSVCFVKTVMKNVREFLRALIKKIINSGK